MDEERYEGESRGLACFLAEISARVGERLGRHSMLYHAVQKALAHRDLKSLRHARDLFNALPRPERLELSAAVLATTLEPAPAKTACRPPATVIILGRDRPRECRHAPAEA
ncbi:MAG: hypothetical protein R3C70_10815 [Geminicoccaceae bacterium]|nr:hypothetical protein [Geminicoccaceae bacterium]